MMAKWSIPFDKLAKKYEQDLTDVVRSACMMMSSQIILRTPVDTGRLRSNWLPALGSPDKSTNDGSDTTGTVAISNAEEVAMSMKAGETFYLTNSLPYANVVEYGLYPNPPKTGTKTVGGYSRQAPVGMVRVVVRDFKSTVEKAVKRRKA